MCKNPRRCQWEGRSLWSRITSYKHIQSQSCGLRAETGSWRTYLNKAGVCDEPVLQSLQEKKLCCHCEKPSENKKKKKLFISTRCQMKFRPTRLLGTKFSSGNVSSFFCITTCSVWKVQTRNESHLLTPERQSHMMTEISRVGWVKCKMSKGSIMLGLIYGSIAACLKMG